MPARKRARTTPREPRGEPKDRLIDAALTLAAERGWRGLGMGEIAAEAGVPLKDTYRLARSKTALLAAFRRRIDEAMLEGGVVSGDSTHDRLFDALMRRFEALKPYRPGLRAILRDSIGDPATFCLAPGMLRSMGWTLTAAGLSLPGVRGACARRLVAGLYLSMMPTFFRDEGEDLGTTMAALDRRLRQAESLLGFLAPGNAAGRHKAAA